MGRTLHGTKSSKFELIETKLAVFPHFLGSFSPAGCLASWRGGQAAPRRTCATCSQRWTLSSPLWPSSTSSIKSCWGLSCTDEVSPALNGVSMRLFFLQYHLFKAVLVVFDHMNSALVIFLVWTEGRRFKIPKTGLTEKVAKWHWYKRGS